MKTKIVSFCELALAVGFLTTASVQAVPITYQYTGNPFTFARAPYTTSDFVSGMLTLAGPLAPNMSLTAVTPTAFSFSDGVQTITNLTATGTVIEFATGPTGAITGWDVGARTPTGEIDTFVNTGLGTSDEGQIIGAGANNSDTPGTWVTATGVPDTGSTLSLMTLTLMALGVAARQFKRAAA